MKEYLTCPKCGNKSFAIGVRVRDCVMIPHNYMCVATIPPDCEMAIDGKHIFSHKDATTKNYPHIKQFIKEFKESTK